MFLIMSSGFVSKALMSAFTAVLAYAVWKLAVILVSPYRSSLRILPGPPSQSWIYGSFPEIAMDDGDLAPIQFKDWPTKYGPTYMFHNRLNVRRTHFLAGLLMLIFVGSHTIH